jgi:pilus assembly protein CpaB
VNEISGVSGFIQPGTRVDVLFTRVFSNGDAATVTILQNVKVLAYGRQLDPAAKVNPTDTSRPTVATLLVTQEDAQKLVLAAQRGRIQLVLRNGTDDDISDSTDPVHSADLGIEEPRKPSPPVVRMPDPVQTAAAAKAKADSEGHTVWIYRGDKLTQEKIN